MKEPQSHQATELNELSGRIIGAALDVHKALGPGLLESMYERALCIELDERRIKYERQLAVPCYYKGHLLGDYRIDLLVDNRIVIEVKSVTVVLPVLEAQLLTYLKILRKKLGLLINFNSDYLTDGIRRRAL